MKTYFRGLIKPEPGLHGTIIEGGVEYLYLYSKFNRKLLKVVKFIQKSLWKIGVAIHDPIFGECTPDFNCCCDCGRKRFIHFSWENNYE